MPGQHTTALESSTTSLKVFDVPELLEHILSFLAFGDLLHAQRVGKNFKAAIDGSIKLQKELHFAPNEQPTKLSVLPLVPVIWSTGNWDQPSLRYSAFAGRYRYYAALDLHLADHVEGNWRNMQITKPPLKEVKLQLFQRYPTRYSQKTILKCETGITLGTMVEGAENLRTAIEGDCNYSIAIFTCDIEKERGIGVLWESEVVKRK